MSGAPSGAVLVRSGVAKKVAPKQKVDSEESAFADLGLSWQWLCGAGIRLPGVLVLFHYLTVTDHVLVVQWFAVQVWVVLTTAGCLPAELPADGSHQKFSDEQGSIVRKVFAERRV